MHRNDDSNYFLYIEPILEEKSIIPIYDDYTSAVSWAFIESTPGAIYGYSDLDSNGDRRDFHIDASWRGVHENCDGHRSTNHDYLLKNGYITNSLCVHYVTWFRTSIIGHNLEKLEKLKLWWSLYHTRDSINKYSLT